jgi:hypothetical protein
MVMYRRRQMTDDREQMAEDRGQKTDKGKVEYLKLVEYLNI